MTKAGFLGRATSIRAATASAIAKAAFAALVLAGAVWILTRELRTTSFEEVAAALRDTPAWAIAVAIGATIASYASLAASEWLAVAWVGKRLEAWRIGLVTFVAYAMSNGLGFSLATGGAARWRFYRAWGFRRAEVAGITLLAGAAVTLSGAVAAGLALLVMPGLPAWLRVLALLLLAPAWLWLGAAPRWLARLAKIEIGSPPLRKRVAALVGALLDWVTSGLALYVLLPDPTLQQFAPFLVVFILGSIVSAVSGVPGGIGVFEAVVLLLSREFALGHETAAALILYRLIYALGPLGLCALGLAAWQARALVRRC